MNTTVFILVFLAGFGLGAWRSGKPGRSLFASALLLPLLLLALTAAGIAYTLLTPVKGDNMKDLAVVAIAMLGGVCALLALAGGMLGGWYRRTGGERP